MTLFSALISSLARVLTGYALAVIFGLMVGVLLAGGTFRAAETVLRLANSAPTLSWTPLLIVALGLGNATIIAAVFLSSFFVIARSTMVAIASVDKDAVEAAMVDGASGMTLAFLVALPCAWPSVAAGLRLGAAYAWRALVGAEMLATLVRHGLGRMIYDARYFNDARTMLVGLLLIGLCGLTLDRSFPNVGTG